ncbi:MAG: PEPxxWA-CTERM sorting domain-containing protein [Rhodanobacter sp.]|nr:PEPxxWA-CTERM sorting domain-containing protein [Rhodanobacter sp.]
MNIKHFIRDTAVAASFAALFSIGTSAHASVILTFGQTDNGDTITATADAGSTKIVANDVKVDITEILGFTTLPVEALFSMALDSVSPVLTVSLLGTTTLLQDFIGTFSFMSIDGKVNYLSGSANDIAVGNGFDAALVGQPGTISFTSDVIDVTSMNNYGMALALADVTKFADCGGTLCSFATSVSGDFSAIPATPEPSTWAMMILGFVGIGFAYRKRKNAQPTLGMMGSFA